jgi:N-acetylglucosamine-6-phosphate deacetylase
LLLVGGGGGVVVALGHTQCEYTLGRAALRKDFTHVTHTYNAQSSFLHREPGAVGAVLTSSGVTAELIADNYHVHPAAMEVLIRCLGTNQVCLITDAMGGAGLPDGDYTLVGQVVRVQNGHATLPDGTIAGSTATLNQCVHNISQLNGVTLQDAVKMASWVPAKAMGFADRLGRIEVGKDASLVAIDRQAGIHMVMVKGKMLRMEA